MEWTDTEEAIIARIMCTETMHDPNSADSDRRIQCTRLEAIRRLQRRKVAGSYQEPSACVLGAATARSRRVSPEHIAKMVAGRAA